YRFVSWEDEKSKGASPAWAPANFEALAGSAAEQATMPARAAQAPEAGDLCGQPAPQIEQSSVSTPAVYTALENTAGSGAASPNYRESSNPAISQKPHKRRRRNGSNVAWDPLRAAALAVLVPLLILSGFALFRHHQMVYSRLNTV